MGNFSNFLPNQNYNLPPPQFPQILPQNNNQQFQQYQNNPFIPNFNQNQQNVNMPNNNNRQNLN